MCIRDSIESSRLSLPDISHNGDNLLSESEDAHWKLTQTTHWRLKLTL